MANNEVTIKRYNGTDWDNIYPKTTIAQVIDLSTYLANLQSDIDNTMQTLETDYYNSGVIDTKLYNKSDTTHTHNFNSINNRSDAFLTFGGSHIAGGISPVDMAINPDFNANRLAFLPHTSISVDYSTNGGTSWIPYNAPDEQKLLLVTTESGFFIGGANTNVTTNCKLRITITATTVYTSFRKIHINCSTNGAKGSNVTCLVRTIGNYLSGTDTWSNLVTNQSIAGWSGWNVLNVSGPFGGKDNQTTQYKQIRFVFGITGLDTAYSNALSINAIRMYGENAWTTPSNLARTGHIYSYDTLQNATFPADIIANGAVKGTTLYEDDKPLADVYVRKDNIQSSLTGVITTHFHNNLTADNDETLTFRYDPYNEYYYFDDPVFNGLKCSFAECARYDADFNDIVDTYSQIGHAHDKLCIQGFGNNGNSYIQVTELNQDDLRIIGYSPQSIVTVNKADYATKAEQDKNGDDILTTYSKVNHTHTDFAAKTHYHSYANIEDKPASYPPSAHTHPYTEITGRPMRLVAMSFTMNTSGTNVTASGTSLYALANYLGFINSNGYCATTDTLRFVVTLATGLVTAQSMKYANTYTVVIPKGSVVSKGDGTPLATFYVESAQAVTGGTIDGWVGVSLSRTYSSGSPDISVELTRKTNTSLSFAYLEVYVEK